MGTALKVTQVGLDCHKNFSRATARNEHGDIAWRQRLDHHDHQALRKELSQWPPNLPVVLEGTFGWGWMCDLLQECGLEPHLASSRKVAAWRDARGKAKSNRIDSDLLSELWPQQPRWWEVWLAPREVRDQRQWLRCRMSLVKMQSGIKNRIHATLHRHGIVTPFSDLFGKAGRSFLQSLIDPDTAASQAQSHSTRATLGVYLRLLEQVRQELAKLTRELRRQVRQSPQAELWRSLPGVSWVLAYTIMAEVGDIGRFKKNRQLCSYSLLVAISDDSGDEDGATPLGRRVGHIGRRTLKCAFVCAGRNAVRKSTFFKEIFNRRTDSGKRDRGRGYIAVARELCRVGHSCVSHNRRYSEERPPQPTAQRPAEQQELLVRQCVGPDRPLAAAVPLA